MSLTAQEALILSELQSQDHVTLGSLMDALYPGIRFRPDRKIIHVLICKLRKKLPGIEIVNIWGKGYAISRAERKRLSSIVHKLAPAPERFAAKLQTGTFVP